MQSPLSHLLWIGRDHSAFFRSTHQWCLNRFDAVTQRDDIRQANQRRCFEPTHIAVVRDDSRAVGSEQLDDLVARFPDSIRFEFRSPLCEGFYRFADRRYNGGMFRWALAQHAFADSLRSCHREPSLALVRPVGMTLVVASQFQMADAILSTLPAGSPAAFCRTTDQVQSSAFHGVTRVIWDDSVLSPGTFEEWSSVVGRLPPHWQQIWLATEVTPAMVEASRACGINQVLPKPLIASTTESEHHQRTAAAA